ncbi:MAG: inositol monophosphatase [Planctomycetes bacterium]|nr:inositol monophosphatase [Planctomycetota bacterium]
MARAGDSDLDFVVAAAENAGRELMRFYRASGDRLAIDFKGPRDLVTAADRKSEEIIVGALQERWPESCIYAEERGGSQDPGTDLWLIDPIDGTTNFAHGHPLFAISIAYCRQGVPDLAVIHAPALGETYTARRGEGSFRNGERIAVSTAAELKDALLATGFSYGRAEVTGGGLDAFARLLAGCRDLRRGGAASLDLAFTAAGTFAGFWEYYLNPHDVAAGALLVSEAGGRVSDVLGGSDYLFGRSIVAATPALHRRLLAELASGPPHPGPPA